MVLPYNCSLPCNYALHSTILLKSHVDFIILSLLIKIDAGCRQFLYFILDICYHITKLSIFFGEFIVEIALAQKYRKKNLKTINKNHMRLFWIYLEFHIWIYFFSHALYAWDKNKASLTLQKGVLFFSYMITIIECMHNSHDRALSVYSFKVQLCKLKKQW